MTDSPYILRTWKEIASVNPWAYTGQTVRKKFGAELKAMGIVVVRWVPYITPEGKRCRKRQASGSRFLLERYFLDVAQRMASGEDVWK